MMPKRFILALSTISLSVLLYVDRVCVSAAKEPIATDLGLTDIEMGWVLSAFALGYALCQTPAGVLSDRFGPRLILTTVVSLWSLFTGLTAAAWNYGSMLLVRFLFGAGEAGAFPGIARTVYSWIPMKERGVIQGLNFAGSRLGGAFALPVVAWMITNYGWQKSFVILMTVGFAWSFLWFFWFRDDPSEHPRISEKELRYITENRQQAKKGSGTARALSAGMLFRSTNMWVAMVQYFCSNFTFFFCLTWLYPHVKETYGLDSVDAGFYAMAPLIFGAIGNVFAGFLVDRFYAAGKWTLSRRAPAIIGFSFAAVGLLASVHMDSAFGAVLWLSLAVFGADMTLSPSWSFCIDIGGENAGAVSGTMNMAGNIGSFVTALAFPYLKEWTGGVTAFFYVGAALNAMAIGLWLLARPNRMLEDY